MLHNKYNWQTRSRRRIEDKKTETQWSADKTKKKRKENETFQLKTFQLKMRSLCAYEHLAIYI